MDMVTYRSHGSKSIREGLRRKSRRATALLGRGESSGRAGSSSDEGKSELHGDDNLNDKAVYNDGCVHMLRRQPEEGKAPRREDWFEEPFSTKRTDDDESGNGIIVADAPRICLQLCD